MSNQKQSDRFRAIVDWGIIGLIAVMEYQCPTVSYSQASLQRNSTITHSSHFALDG
ncbi:MAG: hypothetical protein M3247_06580 [Thermoproteota archaeon]|nr:hypothetical protein [Thermoproteota archaeon]